MSVIPSFEKVILEVHQSLGLQVVSSKDKKKLSNLEKPLDRHNELMEEVVDEVFSQLGLNSDSSMKEYALYNLQGFGNFYYELRNSIFSFGASNHQVLWNMLVFAYIPGLARLIANWNLDERLDKDMPSGSFWYLPTVREESDGERRLVLPVAQVLEWLMDITGKSIQELADELQDANQQKEPDVDAFNVRSIELTLFNWLDGNVPRIDNIEKYFAEGKKITCDGALIFDDQSSTDQRYQTSLEFIERKKLDIVQLRKEIPMVRSSRLEAILNGDATGVEKAYFVELLRTRYAPPSMRTIRQRLLIARTTQDAYRRIGKALLGSKFDETSHDPSRNKVLQLVGLYEATYHLTVEAYNACNGESEENEYFENKVNEYGLQIQLTSVLPSNKDELLPSYLGSILTNIFSKSGLDEELEDNFAYDEASQKAILIRYSKLFKSVCETNEQVQYVVNNLHNGLHFERMLKSKSEINEAARLRIDDIINERASAFIKKSITNFMAANSLAQNSDLDFKVRHHAISRMRELAQTPQETIGAIIVELGLLLNNESRKLRSSDAMNRVEILLYEAKQNPMYDIWGPVFLQYEAKHHLAFDDFEGARKLFDKSLEGLKQSNFGELRGEVARDVLALVITHPPKGFYLPNYEHYYRDMQAFGALYINLLTGELPSIEAVAEDLKRYFNEVLYYSYYKEGTDRELH